MKLGYLKVVFIYTYKNDVLKFLILKKGEILKIPKEYPKKTKLDLDGIIKDIYEKIGIKINPYIFYKRYTSVLRNKTKQPIETVLARIPANTKIKIIKEYNFRWLTFDQCIKILKSKIQKNLVKQINEYLCKEKKMEQINLRYSTVSKSKGFHLSKNLVVGEGSLDSKIMVIGQAPGANEDKIGKPFIGRAGKLLDKLFILAKLKRDGVYITSVVQFFPPKNRLPTKSEVCMCLPFLEKQIDLINPKLIITLGNLATNILTGHSKVTQIHGNILPLKVTNLKNTLCFVTLHPAAGVRFKKNISLLEEDFKKLGFILKDV